MSAADCRSPNRREGQTTLNPNSTREVARVPTLLRRGWVLVASASKAVKVTCLAAGPSWLRALAENVVVDAAPVVIELPDVIPEAELVIRVGSPIGARVGFTLAWIPLGGER